MKNTYECMLLLDNREVKKGWDELKTRVNGLFDKHGAEVLSARRWDERRLTFPIKRQQRATYLLMYFNADAPQVQAIRRDMEFSEAVLRNFVISCEKIPEAAFEPEDSFDIESIGGIDDEPAAPAVKTAEAKSKTEESKTEESKAEESKAEESKAEESKAQTEEAKAQTEEAKAQTEEAKKPAEDSKSEDAAATAAAPAGEDVPSGEDAKEDK